MKGDPVSIIGVGTALVDLKIINPTMALPQSQKEIPEFLSGQNEVKMHAGGSMANVMEAKQVRII